MRKLICILLFIPNLYFAHSQELSIQHDGLTRTYRLHLPQGFDTDSLYPLVINMHGSTSNAFQQELLSAFNAVADAEGFMVVYPNGVNASWNVESTAGVDDVGFISALIDSIDYEYGIDLNRVFATGMSMGGFMSHRLACELSNRIAAIASVTGLLVFFPCNPPRPVPVLQVHGTADPIVPYQGVSSVMAHWIAHDQCPETPVITEFPDIVTTDNSTVTSSYYGPCNQSTEVILYTVNNGEHSWPGSNFILGVTNQDIDASVEIWNFFKKFNLQGSTGIGQDKGLIPEHIEIFPNPVERYMTIEVRNTFLPGYDCRISSLTGCIVRERLNIHESRLMVDCENLAPGIYLVEIASGQAVFHRKVIMR